MTKSIFTHVRNTNQITFPDVATNFLLEMNKITICFLQEGVILQWNLVESIIETFASAGSKK